MSKDLQVVKAQSAEHTREELFKLLNTSLTEGVKLVSNPVLMLIGGISLAEWLEHHYYTVNLGTYHLETVNHPEIGHYEDQDQGYWDISPIVTDHYTGRIGFMFTWVSGQGWVSPQKLWVEVSPPFRMRGTDDPLMLALTIALDDCYKNKIPGLPAGQPGEQAYVIGNFEFDWQVSGGDRIWIPVIVRVWVIDKPAWSETIQVPDTNRFPYLSGFETTSIQITIELATVLALMERSPNTANALGGILTKVLAGLL